MKKNVIYSTVLLMLCASCAAKTDPATEARLQNLEKGLSQVSQDVRNVDDANRMRMIELGEKVATIQAQLAPPVPAKGKGKGKGKDQPQAQASYQPQPLSPTVTSPAVSAALASAQQSSPNAPQQIAQAPVQAPAVGMVAQAAPGQPLAATPVRPGWGADRPARPLSGGPAQPTAQIAPQPQAPVSLTPGDTGAVSVIYPQPGQWAPAPAQAQPAAPQTAAPQPASPQAQAAAPAQAPSVSPQNIVTASSAPAPAVAAYAPAPVAPPVAAKPSPGEEGLYNEALKANLNGRTDESRRRLNEFLERYPNSALAPNAVYWIGESHYADGNFAQAILSFQEVAKRFPRNQKAADARYKIGMSYERLGETRAAQEAYRQLVEEFPNSDLSVQARDKMRQASR